MIVQLNQCEQQMAIFLALSRFANARKRGKPNERIGCQSDWMTDLEGIGGEIAACKVFGVYPDTETELDVLPDYDLITKRGSKVDVKTTKYDNGMLLATKKKANSDVDIYVLMTGSFPTYEAKGWATAEELFSEDNIVNLGHGEGYGLDQSKLSKFK